MAPTFAQAVGPIVIILKEKTNTIPTPDLVIENPDIVTVIPGTSPGPESPGERAGHITGHRDPNCPFFVNAGGHNGNCMPYSLASPGEGGYPGTPDVTVVTEVDPTIVPQPPTYTCTRTGISIPGGPFSHTSSGAC
jgi:hypothetical protein